MPDPWKAGAKIVQCPAVALRVRWQALGNRWRRIGTEFVMEAERETSGRPDEQDNDRQAHNPARGIPCFVITAPR
jgi:hypothetical protein